MKDKLNKILDKYVDVYSYVSVDEYMQMRSSLMKEDAFSNYQGIKEYKTIITLGIAYPSQIVSSDDETIGMLSRYSYGHDYHKVFRNRLDLIEEEFKLLDIGFKSSVDTGNIDERWASYLSGLGFLGKNQFVINKTYGSYMYLATILVDINIEKEFTTLDACGTCNICVDACPTNALDGKFHIDRCISELTQSKKELSDKEIKTINDLVYGCDICQQVCPKNKGIDYHLHDEFEPDGCEQVDLLKLLEMSNKTYKNKYGDNASSWKGALVIKRNALCLLGNREVEKSIPLIRESISKYKDVSWYNNVAVKILNKLERKIR